MTISTRAKSAVLLLISVGIGVLIGALLQARLAERRLEQLALLRTEQGLMRVLQRAVEPADDAQREAVAAVLEGSARQMARHIRQNREESVALLDSTMRALKEVMTEEQAAQLDEVIKEWQKRMKARRLVRRPLRPRRAPPPPP